MISGADVVFFFQPLWVSTFELQRETVKERDCIDTSLKPCHTLFTENKKNLSVSDVLQSRVETDRLTLSRLLMI